MVAYKRQISTNRNKDIVSDAQQEVKGLACCGLVEKSFSGDVIRQV